VCVRSMKKQLNYGLRKMCSTQQGKKNKSRRSNLKRKAPHYILKPRYFPLPRQVWLVFRAFGRAFEASPGCTALSSEMHSEGRPRESAKEAHELAGESLLPGTRTDRELQPLSGRGGTRGEVQIEYQNMFLRAPNRALGQG